MITINELRVTNTLLWCPHGDKCGVEVKVSKIYSSPIKPHSSYLEVVFNNITDSSASAVSVTSLYDVKGFPLSHDVLTHLGFEYNNGDQCFHHKDWSPFVLIKSQARPDRWLVTTHRRDWAIAEIEFVHELQNLMFATSVNKINNTLYENPSSSNSGQLR